MGQKESTSEGDGQFPNKPNLEDIMRNFTEKTMPHLKDLIDNLKQDNGGAISVTEEELLEDKLTEPTQQEMEMKSQQRITRVNIIRERLTELKPQLSSGKREIITEVHNLLTELEMIEKEEELDKIIALPLIDRKNRGQNLATTIETMNDPEKILQDLFSVFNINKDNKEPEDLTDIENTNGLGQQTNLVDTPSEIPKEISENLNVIENKGHNNSEQLDS